MPSAEKRRRQKENTAHAREERDRVDKKARQRRTVTRVAILAVVIIGGVVALNFLTGDDDNVATDTTTTAPPSSTPTTPPDSTSTTSSPPNDIKCSTEKPAAEPSTKQWDAPPPVTFDDTKTYRVTIDTSCGKIVAILSGLSPTGANNFAFLAQQGFYDGLTWHRAVKNFVIQSGDPTGSGSGGPGYSVVTERPTRPFVDGDLAWAKAQTQENGTAGSQFFIVTGDPEALNQQVGGDYQYGYFGSVISGLDVAKKIESFAPAGGDGPPTQPVYINTITVDIENV